MARSSQAPTGRPARSTFLVLATSAATALLIVLFSVIESTRRWDRVSIPIDHSLAVARTIKEKYGIEVIFKDHPYPVTTYHGPIRATNAETARVDRYCNILAPEVSLYPPELMRLSRLKRIVLCRGLSFNGQYRAAVPDFEHDTLYLDVLAGVHSRSYQRSAIHHDLFHIIDYRDDGQLYSDERWTQLNHEKFRYGTGGAKTQDDHGSSMPWNEPGFLTRYAASAVEEDKAEIFAHMMTEYAVVAQRAETDSVIDKKVSFMKDLLARFCPDMSESFWKELGRRQDLTTEVK
jgi:hypothetical protein